MSGTYTPTYIVHIKLWNILVISLIHYELSLSVDRIRLLFVFCLCWAFFFSLKQIIFWLPFLFISTLVHFQTNISIMQSHNIEWKRKNQIIITIFIDKIALWLIIIWVVLGERKMLFANKMLKTPHAHICKLTLKIYKFSFFWFNVISSMNVWNFRQQDVGFNEKFLIPFVFVVEACKHLATKHNRTWNEKPKHSDTYDTVLARAVSECMYLATTEGNQRKHPILYVTHIYVIDFVWICGRAFVCWFRMCVAEVKGIANLHIFFLLFIPYLFCIFFGFFFLFFFHPFFYCKYIEAFFFICICFFFYHISSTCECFASLSMLLLRFRDWIFWLFFLWSNNKIKTEKSP